MSTWLTQDDVHRVFNIKVLPALRTEKAGAFSCRYNFRQDNLTFRALCDSEIQTAYIKHLTPEQLTELQATTAWRVVLIIDPPMGPASYHVFKAQRLEPVGQCPMGRNDLPHQSYEREDMIRVFMQFMVSVLQQRERFEQLPPLHCVLLTIDKTNQSVTVMDVPLAEYTQFCRESLVDLETIDVIKHYTQTTKLLVVNVTLFLRDYFLFATYVDGVLTVLPETPQKINETNVTQH